MGSRLRYRFSPLADLYLFLVDQQRLPRSDDWAPAREAIGRCLTTLVDASKGDRRPIGAFDGLVAEAASVEELEAALPNLPDERVLGLPWRLLVEQAIEALRVASPIYENSVASEREAIGTAAIRRLETQLTPLEPECIAFIHSGLEIPDEIREIPVVLVGSIRGPGAFTSLSDATGSICFIGAEGLDGTSLLEIALHEATHAFDLPSSGRRTSVLARLGQRVAALHPGDRPVRDVPHSLIFVHAGETVRRIVDSGHVHYGVTHTYYDRVPTSKVVLKHWVAHLDGEMSADEAIEAIVAELPSSS